MFCNQCEQTAKGTGCTKLGICGKTDYTASVQDLLVYASRGLAIVALAANQKGINTSAENRLVTKALFSTLTNVNFDDDALTALLQTVITTKNALAQKAGYTPSNGPAAFVAPHNAAEVTTLAKPVAVNLLHEDENINSLQQILLYGLKGLAAYMDHAAILGQEDDDLYHKLHTLLAAGFDNTPRDIAAWTQLVLDCGTANIRAMELLDAGNTGTYGHPVPTSVPLAPIAGKAILITGHDLKDLHDLLVQTQGTGINVYTHGEMLPAHGYPELKKFPHLVGHFGTAWQNQQKEFVNFPGAILFTTNCIQEPKESYANNVFTTGLVGWKGIKHVVNGDFAQVISHAQSLPGFTQENIATFPTTKVLVGFGRNAVIGVADKVIEAVKTGAIKHFFLVGGCDGAKPGRNYYTNFVEQTPKDTVILTLACGKFRFFDKDLGTIGGIPRLLDVGQCNDAFSAVKIALALADAFKCGVNDLPLSFILSWYEQKAVVILLSLFALGVKNIHLGPSLPAFITPAVLQTLVDTFAIRPISTPEQDLAAILHK